MTSLGDPPEFRSSLLVEPSDDGRELLRQRVRDRLLLAFVVVAVILIMWTPVHQRWLGRLGPGSFLYWLHDHFYLPLKGYLFTLGYPLSITWLLSLLMVGSMSLAGFLLARPLSRQVHIRLIRRALDHDRGVAMLLRWCTAQKLAGRGSGMITLVVEHDLQTAIRDIDEFDCHAGLASAELTQISSLAGLFARVARPTLDSRAEVFRVLLLLNRALLRIKLYAPGEDRWKDLGARIGLLLPGLGRAAGQESELAAIDLFRPPLLARDLGYLLGINPPDSPVAVEACRRTALDGIQRRRQLIEGLCHQLELSLALGTPPRPAAPLVIEGDLPDSLALELAVDIALIAAVVHDAPEIALALLESIEALRFAFLAVAPAAALHSLRSEKNIAFVETLCSTVPRLEDYRICAQLLNRQLATASDLRQARIRGSQIIRSDDLELLRSRINRLFLAAGDSRQAVATADWEAGPAGSY